MSKSLIKLTSAIFRSFANQSPIFETPINLSVREGEKWAVVGKGISKTLLLGVLNNQYISIPPILRTYPALTDNSVLPSQAIKFLNFNQRSLPKVHLSARYEFFKEDLDQTVTNFVESQLVNVGNIKKDENFINYVLKTFKLDKLSDNWLMGLSNGQLRRARFAQALVKRPQVLIVDDPFLGLDPEAATMISNILREMSNTGNKGRWPETIVVGLRPQDELPCWITHVVVLEGNKVVAVGPKEQRLLEKISQIETREKQFGSQEGAQVAQKVIEIVWPKITPTKEKSHIKFDRVAIAYRGKQIFRDLSFNINHGEKWHVRGKNGTGKTTLLSLILADHPQSWAASISMDGIPRKVGSTSYFEINSKIGLTSPELHAIFPNLSVWDSIATGLNIEVSGFTVPKGLKKGASQKSKMEINKINQLLEQFPKLEKQKEARFGDLGISDQKLVLFLRAIIKLPQLLVLDEAFSCMDEDMIVICKHIVGENWPETILCVGHLIDEVPKCEKFVELIGPGKFNVGKVED